MNKALPEMLHCFYNTPGSCTDNMTVLERQTARMKWQQEQLQQQHQQQNHDGYYSIGSTELGTTVFFDQVGQVSAFQSLMGYGGGDSLNLGRVLADEWPELGKFEVPDMEFGSGSGSGRFELNSKISRNSMEVIETESNMSSAIGRESLKKRKQLDHKLHNTMVDGEDDGKAKRMKVSTEEGESKITGQNSRKNNSKTANNNRETSGETSKENSKASEVQKPDYIHVRARRGHATDSHSLAERVRREKISERMKYLQDLVPGCNRITGKAGMLDEIINYVQSLQRQVELLSMKLAAVNPSLDFNVDDLFANEVYSSCTTNLSAMAGMAAEMPNLGNHMVSLCGLEMGLINPSDLGLRRTISAPVSLPESFVDSSCFIQMQPSLAWNGNVQNVYNAAFDRERSTTHSEPYTGSVEASNQIINSYNS